MGQGSLTFLSTQERTMADDLKNRGVQDRIRINVHEEHEVRYWTQELRVTPEELKRAVETVGVMVADVKKYLGK